MVEKESLNLINVLQNPSMHFVGNTNALSNIHNIDTANLSQWISFENKFSVEHYSGLPGKGLNEMVIALTIINMQGGITSGYINKLEKIPKDKITRIYYKYQKERKTTHGKNTFKIVCHWLKNKAFISELELNRLLNYETEKFEENAIIDEFNNHLFQNELRHYAQEYWNDIK